MRPATFRMLCLGWLIAAAPLCAAQPDDEPELDAIEQAKHYYGVGSDDLDCPAPAFDGAIVVCARRKKTPRLNSPDPAATTAGRDSKMTGLGSSPIPPRPGVTIGMCFLQKCPKKLYFVDLSTLPEAPAGSDADKIAKGEMRDR